MVNSNSDAYEHDFQHALDAARRLLIQSQILSGRLHQMHRLAIALNRATTQEEALTALGEHAHWLLKFDHCSVCLRTPDGGWEMRTLAGTPPAQTVLVDNNSITNAIATGQPQITNTGTGVGAFAAFQSQIILPLESEDEILGTLNLAAYAPDVFSLEDRRTAYLLAAQLVNSLRHLQLLGEAQQARQQSEQYLAQLEAGAAQADQIGYAVAHDLKSPLHLLHGYVSLLQVLLDDHDDPEVQTYLNEVEQASKNMARIVDQLLWLAQVTDARAVAVPVDMSQAAQQSLWRFTRELEDRPILIEIQPSMPFALGQAGWIEEIFANLIGNAIKYMGEDNPHPHITLRGRLDSAGGMARYEVTDNGIGIAPMDQERIFQMFTRLRLTSADGHGLGLSIVSRIVQRLGGQIGVRSIMDSGSTFWFTLPAA